MSSELAEVDVGSISAMILRVLGHPRVVEANDALDANLGRTEEDGAGDESTTDAIDATPSHEGNPVEVVVSPETGEKDTSCDASLLLRCVKACRVDQTDLEPGSQGVAMGESGLILVPENVRMVRQLSLVRELISSEALQQVLVCFLRLLGEINFLVALFPLAQLFCSPSVVFAHYSFYNFITNINC